MAAAARRHRGRNGHDGSDEYGGRTAWSPVVADAAQWTVSIEQGSASNNLWAQSDEWIGTPTQNGVGVSVDITSNDPVARHERRDIGATVAPQLPRRVDHARSGRSGGLAASGDDLLPSGQASAFGLWSRRCATDGVAPPASDGSTSS